MPKETEPQIEQQDLDIPDTNDFLCGRQIDIPILNRPFSAIFLGASNSGKNLLLSHFLSHFSENTNGLILQKTLVICKYSDQPSYKILQSVCPEVKYVTMNNLPSKEALSSFLQRDGNKVY